MQQALKKKASYYAALSIFFGMVELFIPKILPFFRLGIANVPVLLSLDMSPFYFFLILLLKGIGNSYVSGNLFSLFSLISIAQSIGSGFAMYGAKRIAKGHISSYGLSALGALVSTVIQILLASLYIGFGAMAFMPLMLLLSLLSSILVAFISNRLKLPEDAPDIASGQGEETWEILPTVTLALSAGVVMISSSWFFSLVLFILSLLFQSCTKRKIKLLPHLLILIFMVLSSLLTPNGRVLFEVFSFPVTLGALLNGVSKALKLSSAVAISQAYSTILRPGKGLIGDTLCYFTSLTSAFRTTKGKKLSERINETLNLKELQQTKESNYRTPNWVLILFTILFAYVSIQSLMFR